MCDFARWMGLAGVRGDFCWRLLEFGVREGILLASLLVVILMSIDGEDGLVELPQRPLNGVVIRENKDFVSEDVETSMGSVGDGLIGEMDVCATGEVDACAVGGLSGRFWVVK